MRPRVKFEWLLESRKARKCQLKGLSRKVISCVICRHGLKELYSMHLRGTHKVQFAHNWRQHAARVDEFSLALAPKTLDGTKI